jgi:hypothetical protein
MIMKNLKIYINTLLDIIFLYENTFLENYDYKVIEIQKEANKEFFGIKRVIFNLQRCKINNIIHTK